MSLGSSSNTRSKSPFGARTLASSSGLLSSVPSTAVVPSSVSPSSGLNAFESELVAVFADLVVLLGLPKSMGEIYGLVFASAEPPTFADIEQKLGLSKGSVSQGLRALRELGAIREAGVAERQSDGATDGRQDGPADRRSDGATDGGQVGATERRNDGPTERRTTDEAASSTSVLHVSGLRSQPSEVQASGLSVPPSGAPAARATRWVATTELRQLIGTLLRERLTPYLERQDQRMENAETALEAQVARLSAKDYKALKARLSKLQTWQSRARTVLPVLGKML